MQLLRIFDRIFLKKFPQRSKSVPDVVANAITVQAFPPFPLATIRRLRYSMRIGKDA